MSIGKRALTAAGAFFLATATGHLMQNGGDLVSRLSRVQTVAATEGLNDAGQTAGSVQLSIATDDLIGSHGRPLLAVVLDPADFQNQLADEAAARQVSLPLVFQPAPLARDWVDAQSTPVTEYDENGQVCAPMALELSAQRPAMLAMSVTAPCHANEVIHVSHSGMSFAVRTDREGKFFALLPALATRGDVTVLFASGGSLTDTAIVPDIGSVTRFAIGTYGTASLHINAYIDGANFGEAGHIRPANSGRPTLGLGGFLTQLGDATLPYPVLAEVFTAPSKHPQDLIEVVTELGPDNCGKDVLSSTFSVSKSVRPKTVPLRFILPSCEQTSETLVLGITQSPTGMAMVAASN